MMCFQGWEWNNVSTKILSDCIYAHLFYKYKKHGTLIRYTGNIE